MFIDSEHYSPIMFTMNEQTQLSRSVLKEIIQEQKQELRESPRIVAREKLPKLKELFNTSLITIIQGVRRCGKSTLLVELIDALSLWDAHYFNFEDERLLTFKVADFNLLLEVLYEINGPQKIFFFDEIQVVEGWERFVRRLHNAGHKIVITGSNATLLSQELGTKLTGRHINLELFPFSYKEYLVAKNLHYHPEDFSMTEKRAQILKHFNDYLFSGGFPTYIYNPIRKTIVSLYEDIILRDVVQRYKIDNIKVFRELTLYLTSNATSSISYQNLKEHFNLGSVNTIIKYMGFLENCYFLFLVNPFSPSFKKQVNAPKKVYIISNGFIDKIGFRLNDPGSVLLENLVFLHLRERFEKLFYYKTKNGLEVDFLVYNKLDSAQLIQVSWTIIDSKTKKREVDALIKASEETSITDCIILTESESDVIKVNTTTIHVIPLYQWLLN